MAGFSYTPQDSLGSLSLLRQYLALAGQRRKVHAGTFSVASGDTEAVVTGVGFQPQALLIFDTITTDCNQFADDGNIGVGMAADGSGQWSGSVYMVDLSAAKAATWRDDRVITNLIEAHVDSWDPDGFTLAVDVNGIGGSPNLYAYMAMRGAGGYACGTTLAPSSTGTQAITGLGFPPTSVFVASTMREALSATSDYARFLFGAGDANEQHNVWTSYSSGDVYVDEVAVSGKIITFGIDADGVFTTAPSALAEAELASLDADGFTLDWTLADGTQRYFSWFAVGGPTKVGQFEVGFGAPSLDVDTGRCPAGLIFFMNDVPTPDDYDHNTNTYGSGIAIGCCDRDGNQFLGAYDEASEPSFSVMRSDRILECGVAFGSYARVAGGLLTTMPNFPEGTGTVEIDCRERRMQQIYRRPHLSRLR